MTPQMKRAYELLKKHGKLVRAQNQTRWLPEGEKPIPNRSGYGTYAINENAVESQSISRLVDAGFACYLDRKKDMVVFIDHEAQAPATIGDFGWALGAMKRQEKVRRKGWNGKGMFIVLMPALYLPPFNTQDTTRKVNDRTAKWIGEDNPLDSQPYFAMFTAQGKWQPGWLASQADMLAEDWEIAE